MEYKITTIKSMNDLMRTIGYQPAYFQNEGEVSLVRQLGRNNYPRFHLYIRQNGRDFTCNLHLDQKKPSYDGSKGHSGEYDGALVKDEAERIKNLFS